MRGCFKELQPASVTTTPLPSLPAKIKILGTPAPCKQSRITRASSRNSSYPVISLYIPTCIQNRSLVFPKKKKKKTIYFLRNPLRIRVYRKYRKYRKYFIVTNSLSLSGKKFRRTRSDTFVFPTGWASCSNFPHLQKHGRHGKWKSWLVIGSCRVPWHLHRAS